MKPITGDIKFFEANITHQRNGEKIISLKKSNAVLIDLKINSKKIKIPSLFSLKKFNLLI